MIRRHYTTTHCCSSREPLCLEFVQPGKPLVTSLWWRQGLPIQSHLPRQLSASTSLCSSGTQAVSCSKGQRSGRPRGLPAGTVDLGLSQTPLPLGHPLRCHRPLSGSHCSFPPPATTCFWQPVLWFPGPPRRGNYPTQGATRLAQPGTAWSTSQEHRSASECQQPLCQPTQQNDASGPTPGVLAARPGPEPSLQ